MPQDREPHVGARREAYTDADLAEEQWKRVCRDVSVARSSSSEEETVVSDKELEEMERKAKELKEDVKTRKLAKRDARMKRLKEEEGTLLKALKKQEGAAKRRQEKV